MMMMISRVAAVGLITLVGAGSPAFAQYDGPPPGSYQETCRRVSMQGPVLTAVCRDRGGEFTETEIDVRQCQGSIANRDGRLECGR